MKRHPLITGLYFLVIIFMIPLFAVPDIGQNQAQALQRDRYQAAIEQKARITVNFLKRKMHDFEELKQEIEMLKNEVSSNSYIDTDI